MLQVKKLRHREGKGIAEGKTVNAGGKVAIQEAGSGAHQEESIHTQAP